MRISNIIFCLGIALLFIGCGQKPVYSEKVDIGGSWTYANDLAFEFNIDEIEKTYDLVLELSYGINFNYQNIYVKITTEYPDNKKDEDILSLNLTDGMGMFLGDCNSSKCTIALLLQEKFKFNQVGKYTITIYQNGREEVLEDIYAAELKLYKLN